MDEDLKSRETVIYDKRVNQFVRKYFVKDDRFSDLDLAQTILKDSQEIKKHICLLLLYYDSVCFNVYGENIIVPYLIRVFGKKGFENLVEQKAIKFMLSTSMITHFVTPVKGVFPLQSGELSTDIHKNPEDSIISGFGWSAEQFDRKYHRNLTRKLLKVYSVHPRGVSSRITNSVHQGYKDNLFKTLGLPNIKELGEFSKEDSQKIGDIAEYYLDLSLISHNKYSSIDTYPLELLNTEQLKHLTNTEKIKEYTNKTFNFEKVPNFEMLIDTGRLKIEDIPELRKKPNSIKFRKWIASISQQEFESFDVKEYLDSIDSNKTFWQTNTGRAFKTLSVNTTSTIWSLATGDPGVVGSAISLLDEFYLNSLLAGWSPRFFFKETAEYLNKND